MATKSLLTSLQFRSLAVSLPNVSRITVRYGTDIGVCAGHSAARKFARNFLPVLLYNNPGIECSIQRSEAFNDTPGVLVLHSDGKERVFDTRAMAGENPGRVDRELFKLLAGEGSPVAKASVDLYMDARGRDKVPTDGRATGATPRKYKKGGEGGEVKAKAASPTKGAPAAAAAAVVAVAEGGSVPAGKALGGKKSKAVAAASPSSSLPPSPSGSKGVVGGVAAAPPPLA